MSQPCRRRDICRLCGGNDLARVLKLTPTPPANAFIDAEHLNREQACFPLDVFFCKTCHHVQLLDVVDPALLFENYVYVSGTSPSFVKHFEGYAEAVLERFAPGPESLVVDIGSNDGTLLRAFKGRDMAVLGVDPARKIAEKATKSGIETITGFFSAELAAEIRKTRGPARIITANNVFAHADDLSGIVGGIKALLADDGVFVFEVSYLADVIEKTLFDTIYHEHLAYHSLGPLKRFFEDNGMTLFSADRVDSHGGSIRGFAGLSGHHDTDASVAELIAAEENSGLYRADTFVEFGRNIDALGAELQKLTASIKAEGKSIAGFGAPAKATTLMHHFGLGPETIDFIVDDSPLKQNLFTPGHHIPVFPATTLYDRKPDYALILAWNFARPIMENHQAFQDAGGRFIVPLPELEIT
ncbi:MAG: class I SAM-dependent methyltransferase [Rhodospirillales bacterium]